MSTLDQLSLVDADAPAKRAPVELHGLQILRGLAASGVALHHCLRKSDTVPGHFSPNWLTLSMSSGVDLFFVISGFIMLYTTFGMNGPKVSPRQFLLRRALRIYPFYWFCCVVLILFVEVGIFKSPLPDSFSILRALLLLPGDNSLIGVSWTLTYELFFYLIFSVALLFRSRLLCVLATSGMIIVAFVFGRFSTNATTSLFLGSSVVFEFCFGLGIALLVSQRGIGSTMRPGLACLGATVIAIGAAIVPHATTAFLDEPYRAFVWGLPATMVVAVFLPMQSVRGWISRALVQLGDASYAIYLTHFFVVIGYAKLLQNRAVAETNQLLIVPIVLAACLTTGILAHFAVEKPLLKYSRAMIGRVGILT